MDFESFIYAQASFTDEVETIEKWIEGLDTEEWFNLGTKYCIEEKEAMLDRIEKGVLNGR